MLDDAQTICNTIGHLTQTFVTKYMGKSYWLTGTTSNTSQKPRCTDENTTPPEALIQHPPNPKQGCSSTPQNPKQGCSSPPNL